MTVEKPDVNDVWASTALPINITDPDIDIPGKTTEGWLGTDIPPHTTFNWEQNRQGQFNKHVNVEGMPVWDADTDYLLNSYSKDPTTGRLYRSLTGTELAPNQGNQPSLSGAEWKELIETELELVVSPTNLAPSNGTLVADLTPKLVTSEYRSLYGLNHRDSEYRVARDAAMTDLVYLSGSLGPVEEHTVALPLAADDTYYFDARYQDEDGSWSARSTPTSFDIPLTVVQTPNPQTPANGDVSVTDVVQLTADAFMSLPVSVHSASQWQISTDPTFATVDFDSGEDLINLTSYTQSGLSLTTPYYWRVRYKSNTIGFSNYSEVFNFNTIAAGVGTPTNIFPSDTTSGIGSSIALSASSFAAVPVGSQTHVASQWQIALDESFTDIVFDSGEDTFNRESIIATGTVSGVTTHYWRVRYKGSTTGWSPYSAFTTFITVQSFSDWITWDGTNDGPISTQLGNSFNSGSAIKADLAPLGGDRFLKVANGGPAEWTVIGVDGITLSSAQHFAPSPAPSGPTGTSVLPAGTDRAIAIYAVSQTVRARIITVTGNNISFGTEYTISGSIGSQNYWNIASIDDDNFVIVEQVGASTSTLVSICSITAPDTISQGAKTTLTSTGQMPNYGKNVDVIGNRLILSKSPSINSVQFTSCLLDTTTQTVTQDVISSLIQPSPVLANIVVNSLTVKWLTENTFLCATVESVNAPFEWYVVLATYEEGVGITLETSAQMPNTLSNLSVGDFAIISPQEVMFTHTGTTTQTLVGNTFLRVVNGNIFPQKTVESVGGSGQATVRKSLAVVSGGRVLSASGDNVRGSETRILNGGSV